MRHNLSQIKALIEDRRNIAPELFSGRKVHREIIEEMLDMARWAPTHRFTQPWFFKVFMGDGRQQLGQFMANTYQNVTDEASFNPATFDKLRNRPLLASAVIGVGLRRDAELRDPLQEEIASVAMAVQNMWLVAAAHGIGMYWGTGGVVYTPQMHAFMGLGEHDLFMGLVYVGYPANEWPRPTRRRPIEYFSEWVEG